jgi:energy-coupling factor transporter ATP-binding protein EcfA2
MFKLERLVINRYRNVRPGTELAFNNGLNLILGQNAAGKTTLLALLSSVCRSAFDAIADEEFELEYQIGDDRFAVTARVGHRRVIGTDDDAVFGEGPRWDDSYEIEVEDRSAATLVSRMRSDDLRGVDLIMDWSFIAAALTRHQELVQLRQGLLWDFGSAYRFDESLDCFSSIIGLLNPLAGPATAPVARAEWSRDFRGTVNSGAFMPHALSLALQTSFKATKSAERSFDLGDAERSLGQKLAGFLDVDDVSLVSNVVEQQIAKDERRFVVEGFSFEVTRPDGTIIHHDRLSYGQKRLLAFLYYLECNPAVVIADELVNGLHHRWIDACMRALGDRQAFLTSQNPLLFDYVSFDSVERVCSSFITCKLELVDGREQLVWQNMTHDEAQIFFDAYEVGIEHVGDILITRGLW